MAGTGKQGVVPVHLEGLLYERPPRSESGKRVFGRIKGWEHGVLPIKSNNDDFQETSSDVTNQGNISETHKSRTNSTYCDFFSQLKLGVLLLAVVYLAQFVAFIVYLLEHMQILVIPKNIT